MSTCVSPKRTQIRIPSRSFSHQQSKFLSQMGFLCHCVHEHCERLPAIQRYSAERRGKIWLAGKNRLRSRKARCYMVQTHRQLFNTRNPSSHSSFIPTTSATTSPKIWAHIRTSRNGSMASHFSSILSNRRAITKRSRGRRNKYLILPSYLSTTFNIVRIRLQRFN